MVVPADLSVETNYAEVVPWLNDLRGQLLRGKPRNRYTRSAPSYFDFAKVNRISAPTALIVASEYDRLQHLKPGKLPIYNFNKWKPETLAVLGGIGFFDFLGIQTASDPGPSDEHASIQRFQSDAVVQGPIIGGLLDAVLGAGTTAAADERAARKMKLYPVLIEATENTRQHAYPAEFQKAKQCIPNWWVTGAVSPKQNRLVLAVFDQGVSIPGSLQMNPEAKTIVQKVLARLMRRSNTSDSWQNDHHKLRLAMKYGKSSTGADYRGKGLPKIKEVVEHCQSGRLLVISRHARYVYVKGKKPQVSLMAAPLGGTLVVWDLVL